MTVGVGIHESLLGSLPKKGSRQYSLTETQGRDRTQAHAGDGDEAYQWLDLEFLLLTDLEKCLASFSFLFRKDM